MPFVAVLAAWSTAFLPTIAPGAQDTEPPVALVVTYADGRTVSRVLGARPSRSWTPMFPRLSSWHGEPGSLPVAAIQYASVREGRDVRVRVSVLLGRPHQEERHVAEVLVRAGDPVVVDALQRFGIQPVRLSLAPVGAVALQTPVIESQGESLEVWLDDLITEPPPRYRLAVRNRSSRAVRSFWVESFRDGRRALSARQGDRKSLPLIEPGGTHTFDVAVSSGRGASDVPVSPQLLERIAITSVLFDDLSVEGDATPAAQQLVIDAGRLTQLRRVLTLLSRALRESTRDPSHSIDALRTAVAALPISAEPEAVAAARLAAGGLVNEAAIDSLVRLGLQNLKELVTQDLRQFEVDTTGTDDAATRFLRALQDEYTAWLGRLAMGQ